MDAVDSIAKRLRHYLVFLGQAHSGHSLVGALIDAHPHAAISNELHLLKRLQGADLTASEVLSLTYRTAVEQSAQEWKNTGYSYRFDFGSQGSVEQLLVLGDKKGGASARLMFQQPELFDRLLTMFARKLRVIVVMRNPYDNIAARSFRLKQPIDQRLVDLYFNNMRAIAVARQKLNTDQLMVFKHEDFVQSPENHMRAIYSFLGLEPLTELLQGASAVVRPSANTRRKQVAWPADVVTAIEKQKMDPQFADLTASYTLA